MTSTSRLCLVTPWPKNVDSVGTPRKPQTFHKEYWCFLQNITCSLITCYIVEAVSVGSTLLHSKWTRIPRGYLSLDFDIQNSELLANIDIYIDVLHLKFGYSLSPRCFEMNK